MPKTVFDLGSFKGRDIELEEFLTFGYECSRPRQDFSDRHFVKCPHSLHQQTEDLKIDSLEAQS